MKSLPSKQPRYRRLFRMFLLVRMFFGFFIFYQYAIFTADTYGSRGGVVVEAIFDPISYLPYISTKTKDLFYQNLLFKSCISYSYDSSGSIVFTEDLCEVKTKDNKTYDVIVKSGFMWLDNVPVTAQDVFFTYSKIIKNNKRGISMLEGYNSLDVTQPSSHLVRVVFPIANVDNMLFFLFPILPFHLLENATIQQYREVFGANPITNTCATVIGGIDEKSLIFDFQKCSDTYLLKYQLKYFGSFSGFLSYQQEKTHDLVIDFYEYPGKLPGYKRYDLLTQQYMAIFFNTFSSRLSKRARRALGGFIASHFFTGETQKYIIRDHLLFDLFLSDGRGLEDIILTQTPFQIEKRDLDIINMPVLLTGFVIGGHKGKRSYQIDTYLNGPKPVTILFSGERNYQKISITVGTGTTGGKEYLIKDNKVTFFLHPSDLSTGNVTQYVIRGIVYITDPVTKKTKEEKILLSDVDIYYVPVPDKQQAIAEYLKKRIKVVYYKDEVSMYVVQRLQSILEKANVLPYFAFIGYDVVSEFDGKIASKDYDIVIRPIYLGLKQDVSSLLLAEDKPHINPSLYANTTLSNYLFYYVNEKNFRKKQLIKENIDNIYGRDMPFVVLGKIVKPLYIHKGLQFHVFGMHDSVTFKKQLYRSIQIKKSYRLNWKKFFSGQSFMDFYQNISSKDY